MRPLVASATTTASRTRSNRRPIPRSSGARTLRVISVVIGSQVARSLLRRQYVRLLLLRSARSGDQLVLKRYDDSTCTTLNPEFAQDAAHVEVGCRARDD